MFVYIASDHAGFILKKFLVENLQTKGFLVKDFGAEKLVESDDYPDFIFPCVKDFIKETRGDTGKGICIVIGGSGTGEAICANRVRGARAVVFNNSNLEIIKLGRMHNNANVLSVGARFVNNLETLEAVKIFMSTQFEGGRHAKRVLKIDSIV